MKKIPVEDLKLINDTFSNTEAVETLGKNSFGRVVKAQKKVSNNTKIEIQDFTGRVLKHSKSVVISGRGTLILGSKGVKFEQIPAEKRKLVVWLESDFE